MDIGTRDDCPIQKTTSGYRKYVYRQIKEVKHTKNVLVVDYCCIYQMQMIINVNTHYIQVGNYRNKDNEQLGWVEQTN